MDINVFIGNKIKELRNAKNITQEEIGEYLGVTSQTVSRYESGKLKTNQDVLFKLAEYFKVSVNDFFPDLQDNGTANLHEDSMYDEGISISQLSIMTGLNYNKIKDIYHRTEKLPRPSDLINIAKALNNEPFYYLSSAGYVDDETLEHEKLYDSGIRYLLSNKEKKILCEYVCEYWNAEQNKHKLTYEEVYNAIFSEEKQNFSYSEVRSMLAHNFDYEQFSNLVDEFNEKVKNGDIINISNLSTNEKEQIKYMVNLMKKNQKENK